MSSLAVAVFPDFENTAKSIHSEQTESSCGLTKESLFKLTGMHSLPQHFVSNHAICSLEICTKMTARQGIDFKNFRLTKTLLNNS